MKSVVISRILLTVFCCVLLVAGLGLFGFSIWLRVDSTTSANRDIVTPSQAPPMLDFAYAALLTTTGLSAVFAVFGLLAVWRRSHILLLVFALMLILVIVGGATTAGLSLNYKTWISKYFKLIMQMRVMKQYGMRKYSGETENWDRVQSREKCCGIETFSNFVGSNWWNSSRGMNVTQFLPASCCADPYDEAAAGGNISSYVICQKQAAAAIKSRSGPGGTLENRTEPGVNSTDDDLLLGDFDGSLDDADNSSSVVKRSLPDQPTYFYQKGCSGYMKNWFDDFMLSFVAVGISLAIYQILGMVLAFWHRYHLRHALYQPVAKA